MAAMGRWKKAPPELVRIFEEVIAAVPGAQSRKMFGYPAAFVNGQMFTGVFQNRLFVRLSEPGRAALAKLGGKPFEPMPGRPMREYVEVPPKLLRSKTALGGWMTKAHEYASTLPAKGPGLRKSPRKAGRRGRR